MFYDILFEYEPTAKIFKEGERATREGDLVKWYENLLNSSTQDKFWEIQWLVGLLHIKRDVKNHMMLGMPSRVQFFFLQKA